MNPNDKIVRDHHVKQALLKAIRRKQPEPKLPLGPGNLKPGTIFDCDRKYFQKLLTTYWNRLFVGWNPYKNNGLGCWEVWQRPIRRQELNDMEHWVADLSFLTPKFIDELRRMDAWEYRRNVGRNMDEDMNRAELDREEKLEREENESIRYAVRHNKSAFKQLKTLAQAGYNPFWFFSDRKQGSGQV